MKNSRLVRPPVLTANESSYKIISKVKTPIEKQLITYITNNCTIVVLNYNHGSKLMYNVMI